MELGKLGMNFEVNGRELHRVEPTGGMLVEGGEKEGRSGMGWCVCVCACVCARVCVCVQSKAHSYI